MSSEIAWRAASLISSGAAKSGNPCDRLTALCFSARRVISRITDSVNCSAFAESMRREICAMERSGAVIAPSQNTQFIVVAASATADCPLQGKFKVYRSEEHTSELQSRQYLVCRLLLEKKKKIRASQ